MPRSQRLDPVDGFDILSMLMHRLRSLLCCLLSLVFAGSLAHATLTWRPGEGWSDESGADVSASSSRDQLEMAHKLEAQGSRDAALKAYKGLLRRWPLSFFAPEAQYRTGKILEDQGDFYNAFQAFQKMFTKYPSSEYFEQALNEQYRIANLFLAGEPQRIWKVPVGPSMEKTIEMYERVIKNAPYGTFAAQCQFDIGLAREKQRKFTDAVDSYQKVLDNYPSSDVASNAQYQIGYAWMRSSFAGDYDMGAAKKAVDAFQDYLVRYPSSDKAVQAQENIQKLGLRQTQGAFNVAKFYETQHESRAAFIYYNEVVREDPNSPQAQIAKKRIQELRPLVEALPGGIGPDGTGNVGAPQKVASGPPAPITSTPQTSSDPNNAPLPNNEVPDATNEALPADPNAPLTSSSPGATANSDAQPAPAPASTNAPASESTPTPVPTTAPTPAPASSSAAAPAPAPAATTAPSDKTPPQQ
jgi:outer membrane protein assembly factor BamD